MLRDSCLIFQPRNDQSVIVKMVTTAKNPLFKNLPDLVNVYFVHSYHMECLDTSDIIATCNYGQILTAAVNKGNIFGTQFHPEKSQDIGLKILENFVQL